MIIGIAVKAAAALMGVYVIYRFIMTIVRIGRMMKDN